MADPLGQAATQAPHPIQAAASNAFEKISDQNVKNAAKGLALAAIGKLHIEIDKL